MSIKQLYMLMGFIFIAGCAFDLAHVSFTPTTYLPKSDKSFKIIAETSITGMPCGYSRSLHSGSTWHLGGTIPEGEVYKSRDQVLTVECSNVHEAYLVVSDEFLVGFYLPVEKGFVKISKSIRLDKEENKHESNK